MATRFSSALCLPFPLSGLPHLVSQSFSRPEDRHWSAANHPPEELMVPLDIRFALQQEGAHASVLCGRLFAHRFGLGILVCLPEHSTLIDGE